MKYTILFPLLFTLQSIAIKGNDILTGKFAVNIPGNPATIFPPIQNFDAKLTKQGPAGKAYPVAVTHHHIIPLSHFIKFYNKLIQKDEFPQLKSFWFRFNEQFIEYYSSKAVKEGDRSKYADKIKNVNKIIEGLFYNKIVHDPKASRPKNFDDFQSFYAWLPGNLFIGPVKRSDNPGQHLDADAKKIVGVKRFQDIEKAYKLMQLYIDGKKVNFNDLSDLLRDFASLLKPEDLKSSNWVPNKDGTYKIKK